MRKPMWKEFREFIALVVFLLVRMVNRINSKVDVQPAAATTKDCSYCLSSIPLKALRCAHCAVDLPEGIVVAQPAAV